MTRIVLHIDRVVVEETALTPRDAETLRRALEAELGVLLRREVIEATRRSSLDVRSATHESREAPPIADSSSATATGRAAARSMAHFLGSLLEPSGTCAAAPSAEPGASSLTATVPQPTKAGVARGFHNFPGYRR